MVGDGGGGIRASEADREGGREGSQIVIAQHICIVISCPSSSLTYILPLLSTTAFCDLEAGLSPLPHVQMRKQTLSDHRLTQDHTGNCDPGRFAPGSPESQQGLALKNVGKEQSLLERLFPREENL